MLTNAAPAAFARAAVATAAAAALLYGLGGSTIPAQADTAVAPESGAVTVVGAGWGHGKGMSQWGAYGAASKGLSYAEIIDFYYPGTTLKTATNQTMRIWITADNNNKVYFRPDSGLIVKDSAGKKVTLPTGSKYTKWRINRVGSKRVLAYRSTSGKYVRYSNSLNPGRVWYVKNTKTNKVRLVIPGGTTKTYRGRIAAKFSGSGMRTVNHVPMESYLRSVVPAEMPASWNADAVRAQAVAARTYAAWMKANTSYSGYDLCDTSACQVYKGVEYEHPSSDAAIEASANKMAMYKGAPALTMFSSSNGGWSASGGSGYPYLKAQKDPYDGVKRDQSWSVTLSSTKIQNAYSSIGKLEAVQVTERDGDGTYGGRVETIKIKGSKGSVTVSGGTFKSKFGLKERLFKIVGGSVSTASSTATTTATETTTATATATADDASTGELTGAVLKAYNALSAKDADTLGDPKTGVVKTSTGTYADFDLGRITCPAGKDCIVSFG
ncbi:MAG: SpoIID/LytB domain-containing protein [Propionibacteriaceae bacterium]|nr:SpoIID/LytB domain-containing protein [Propionibacteriaceae bacterium]